MALTDAEKENIIRLKAEQQKRLDDEQRRKQEEFQRNRKPLTEEDIAKIVAIKKQQAEHEKAEALAKAERKAKRLSKRKQYVRRSDEVMSMTYHELCMADQAEYDQRWNESLGID